VGALYPDQPMIFFALYAGFILISLGVAFCVTGLIRDPVAVRPFLGALMLFLAVYFGLSVIVIPQFADLDKIYRISRNEVEMSQPIILLIILCIGAVLAGFINPFKRE
jgi:predicted transporter